MLETGFVEPSQRQLAQRGIHGGGVLAGRHKVFETGLQVAVQRFGAQLPVGPDLAVQQLDGFAVLQQNDVGAVAVQPEQQLRVRIQQQAQAPVVAVLDHVRHRFADDGRKQVHAVFAGTAKIGGESEAHKAALHYGADEKSILPEHKTQHQFILVLAESRRHLPARELLP